MKLELKTREKAEVFTEVENFLKGLGLNVVSQDAGRPWGGFFVIDEKQAHHFGKLFLKGKNLTDIYISSKLSPKILLVQQKTRLSWQYHHRRAEIWKVVSGPAGVVTSETDTEGKLIELKTGETVRLARGQRHRLVRLNEFGLLAE